MTKQQWIKEIVAEEVAGAILRFIKEKPYALHQIATDAADVTVSRLQPLIEKKVNNAKV